MPLELSKWEQGLLPTAVAQGGREIDEAYEKTSRPAPEPDPADTVDIDAPPEATDTVEPTREPEQPASVADQPKPEQPPQSPDNTAEVARLSEQVRQLQQQIQGHVESYRSLQGKYEAEVPRLAARLRDRDNEIADLKEQLEDARLANASPQERYGLTDDEVESLGENEIRILEKIARKQRERKPAAAAPDPPAPEPDIDPFRQSLTLAVPNWESTNALPAFHAFVAQRDTQTGMSRQSVLDASVASRNVVEIARIFHEFNRTQQPVNPAPPSTARPSLESQVMPETAAPGPPTQTGPMMSQQDWEQEWQRACELSARNPVEGERKIKQLRAILEEGRIKQAA